MHTWQEMELSSQLLTGQTWRLVLQDIIKTFMLVEGFLILYPLCVDRPDKPIAGQNSTMGHTAKSITS